MQKAVGGGLKIDFGLFATFRREEMVEMKLETALVPRLAAMCCGFFHRGLGRVCLKRTRRGISSRDLLKDTSLKVGSSSQVNFEATLLEPA